MDNGTIIVENLVKTFKGDVHALRGISTEVKDGEFFAFLGPNGAGKSTAIQVITTLLLPTSGKIYVSGYDVVRQPEDVRRQIGVALQETGVDSVLTGRELLEMQAQLFGYTRSQARQRADELLEKINLTEDAHRRIGNYSGGMRRRLDLALSLVHEPKILFLDEPTTGLDPFNRIAIWQEIRQLNQQKGTTIFLTTQYLEEADQLADRVQIINKGQIVASGTPAELKQLIGADVIELGFTDAEMVLQAGEHLGNVVNELRTDRLHADRLHADGLKLTLYVENGAQVIPELVRILDAASLPPQSIQVSPPTLDDVFLKVTGEEAPKQKETGEVGKR